MGFTPIQKAAKILKIKQSTSTEDVIVVENNNISSNPTSTTPQNIVENQNNNQQNQQIINTPAPEPKKDIKLDVPPGSPEAPQQSNPISKDQIPKRAISIIAKENSMMPNGFTVSSGEEILLAFTSGDKRTHVFAFQDQELEAVAIGVGPYETRTISFKAPKAGSYNFSCGVPGHASIGESGTMIVK